MKEKLIDVELLLEQINEGLIAHLSFKNITSKSMYLEKQTIYFNNEVRNTYFEIFDKKGREVDYTGIMAKRLILPEDFIEVNPMGQVKASVSLHEYYKIRKGNKYTIQYYAFNPGYMDLQQLIEMQSNKVEILYQ